MKRYPSTEKIAGRYDLPGSDHPHGFAIDEEGRLAFVSSEGNATLQVLDLRRSRTRRFIAPCISGTKISCGTNTPRQASAIIGWRNSI